MMTPGSARDDPIRVMADGREGAGCLCTLLSKSGRHLGGYDVRIFLEAGEGSFQAFRSQVDVDHVR